MIFFLCREIHRMVEWLVSESMVMYYIHLFRDSTWPGGELAKPAAQRTELVSILHHFGLLFPQFVLHHVSQICRP